MNDFITFFVDNIVNKFLAQPALLLGVIVFIGYLALGKKIYEAFAGFLKTYVGYSILLVGTAGLVASFNPIIEALRAKFNIDPYVIDPYFGQTSGQAVLEVGKSLGFVGYVMLIAFAVNIILVLFRKQTKCRSLFLTGHIMYQQSAVLLWALYWVIDIVRGGGDPTEPVSFLVVIGTGILLGIYWSVMSNLIVEATNEVSDGAGFTIGHQQMLMDWFSFKVGGKIGNPKHSVEHVELPGFMSLFKDSIVSNVIIMTLFTATIMLIVGEDGFDYDTTKYNFFTYIIFVGASFAVYITIILTGARIFVTELTNSFTGISNKILKGSVPAVDCPVLFGFQPNTPVFGFIFGFIGQLVAIGILILFKSPILILSGFVSLFFDNGTIAVYANKAGGRRAVFVLTFIAGIIQVFGSALVLSLVGGGEGVVGWMGMFDWATMVPGLLFLGKYIGISAIVIGAVVLLIIPQLQYRKNKENYFTTMRYAKKGETNTNE